MRTFKTWAAVPVNVSVSDVDGDLWRKTDEHGGFVWWPQSRDLCGGWRGPQLSSFRPSDLDAPYEEV